MAVAKHLRFISLFGLVALAALAADDGKSGGSAGPSGATTPETATSVPRRAALPPVLRKTEPDDNHFVVLPGLPPAPAPVRPPVKAIAPPVPAKPFTPPVAPSPSKAAEVAVRREPAPPELKDPGKPVLRSAPRPIYPEGFEQDSGIFCQKQIGSWKEADALTLLGAPSGNRPAYDDKQGVNGRIYAFTDPTNRYRQLELDFDSETGALRTVFAYPWKMTWQECRRIWGANVSAAEANQGRRFYSYLNRRLDVLVDSSGKVISIGLY